MIHRNGDLFTTDALWIGHGCNVDGVMGAGVAKTVRDRYPLVYEAYRKQCLGGNFRPGDAYGIYQHRKVIINLATQDRPGANARYEWVFDSTVKAAQKVRDDAMWNKPKVIAVPELGSGIGGLEWDKVATVLSTVEILIPEVEFEVWHWDG